MEELKNLTTQLAELEKRVAALENPEPVECDCSSYDEQNQVLTLHDDRLRKYIHLKITDTCKLFTDNHSPQTYWEIEHSGVRYRISNSDQKRVYPSDTNGPCQQIKLFLERKNK